MRIQHNIPAMSAYRNYTNNVSAVSKNLEKLSSGYRINRAGDDAAGLAISEKMRAQISGLEQAQSNAKSGINLVQTAEGALTEVHDMLNRMVTLAEQSANGTYDNDVDRVQLQKEVSQLRSEINRIADSANFNGIKLLDGSLDSTVSKTVGEAVFGGLDAMELVSVETGNAVESEMQLHKDGKEASKTSFTIDLNGAQMTGTAGEKIKGILSLSTKDSTGAKKVAFQVDYEVTVGPDGKVKTEDLANAIAKAIQGDSGDGKATISLTSEYSKDTTDGDPAADDLWTYKPGTDTAGNIEYEVKAEGEKLTFTMSDTGFETAKAGTDNELFIGGFNVGVAKVNTKEDGGDTVRDYEYVHNNVATIVDMGSKDSGEQLAAVTFGFEASGTAIKDGTGIQVGDQYYVWGGSDETVNGEYGDNVHVVDVRDLVNDDKVVPFDGTDTKNYRKTLTEALARLTEAAEGNKMFNVELNEQNQIIAFHERADYEGDADLTTLKGLQEQLKTFNNISENVTTKAATGKALTLQIGDTAESFNKLAVNVKDMHAAAMGIGDIDISTQEGAAAAMSKIKDAINYVSDVRGDLGATQNRLDHTIKNLSVMQENIQDAESTIRDVDVAKEMMAYTKNNILVQSAQAMLAQANQLPQGVLQLLG